MIYTDLQVRARTGEKRRQPVVTNGAPPAKKSVYPGMLPGNSVYTCWTCASTLPKRGPSGCCEEKKDPEKTVQSSSALPAAATDGGVNNRRTARALPERSRGVLASACASTHTRSTRRSRVGIGAATGCHRRRTHRRLLVVVVVVFGSSHLSAFSSSLS